MDGWEAILNQAVFFFVAKEEVHTYPAKPTLPAYRLLVDQWMRILAWKAEPRIGRYLRHPSNPFIHNAARGIHDPPLPLPCKLAAQLSSRLPLCPDRTRAVVHNPILPSTQSPSKAPGCSHTIPLGGTSTEPTSITTWGPPTWPYLAFTDELSVH